MYGQKRETRKTISRVTKKCSDCENAIFDEVWGEYKCKVLQVRIRKPDDQSYCTDYKKKK